MDMGEYMIDLNNFSGFDDDDDDDCIVFINIYSIIIIYIYKIIEYNLVF